jgi:phage-related tail fiber protein
MKVASNIDLLLNQLLQAVLETLASNPGSVTNGRIFYNSTTGKLSVGEGGTYRTFLITGTRLDELAAPTADVALNSRKITGLATPTADTDAANKGYVDNAIEGLSWKQSVRLASTANIASMSGNVAVDGQTTAPGDRVLVKNQTTQSANGIYVAAAGAWARAEDADSSADMNGAAVLVREGTQAETRWVQTADNPTIGSTNIVWVDISGGGSSYTAGAGLALTTNDFSVNVDGVGIEINADTLRLKDLGVVTGKIADNAVTLTAGAGQKVTGTLPIANGGTGGTTAATARAALGVPTKFAADITGNAALTQFTVNHALGTLDVIVQVWEASTGQEVLVDITKTDTNNVRIDFAVAPANAKVYRVVVLG